MLRQECGAPRSDEKCYIAPSRQQPPAKIASGRPGAYDKNSHPIPLSLIHTTNSTFFVGAGRNCPSSAEENSNGRNAKREFSLQEISKMY
jgi:hypothetical protein